MSFMCNYQEILPGVRESVSSARKGEDLFHVRREREGGEWTSLIVIAAFPYDLHSLDRAPGIAIVQTARRHPLRRTRILARSGFGNLDLILNRIAQQKSISSLEREGQRKEKEGVAIAIGNRDRGIARCAADLMYVSL